MWTGCFPNNEEITQCPNCNSQIQKLGTHAFCLDCDWDNLPEIPESLIKHQLDSAIDSMGDTPLGAFTVYVGTDAFRSLIGDVEEEQPTYRGFVVRPARNLVGEMIVILPTEIQQVRL